MNESQVIKSFDKLVKKLARKFGGQGLPVEDLEQEARIAVVLAAREWDAEREAGIATLAESKIEWRLEDLIRGQRVMDGGSARGVGAPSTRSLDAELPGEDGDGGTMHDLIGTRATQDLRLECVEAIESLTPSERAATLAHIEGASLSSARASEDTRAGRRRGQPRGVRAGSIRAIAAELGISKSAAARRLASASARVKAA